MSFEIFTEEDKQKEKEQLAAYDLDISLFDKLGFKIKQIVPERNCYRLETDKGFYCLKKMDMSYEDIYIIQEMTAHLKKNGFINTFEIMQQPHNEILVPYNGSQYYLTSWMDGRESDYLNLRDIKDSIQTLAKFHLASEGFESKFGTVHRRLYGRWTDGFSQKLQEIKSAKEILHAEGRGDETTQICSQYLRSCEKSARHVLEGLEKSFYNKLGTRDASRKGFIHHDYGLHNILHTFDSQTYIGGLESFAFDIRIHDLGYFIFRIMRRKGWDIDSAFDMISNYEEIYKLDKEDYQALALYLAFPHDYKHFYRQCHIGRKEAEDLEELDRINIESEYNQTRKSFLNQFERYSELL